MKTLGFSNIKIYNGGLKDWRKNGFPVESHEPLPDVQPDFIDTDSFYQRLKQYDKKKCQDNQGTHLMLILDLRNDNHLNTTSAPPVIDTTCPSKIFLLDDLLLPEVRKEIPKDVPVITLTETGNRDEFIIRYLSQYGYTNLKGLKSGMRGWIKQRYPTKE